MNAEPTTPSTARGAREKTVSLRPGFARALRGIWLFTWKPQLTFRRAPLLLAGLFVLPLVIYATILPPRLRGHGSLWVGDVSNPRREANRFMSALASVRIRLQREQRQQVELVYDDEYGQADRAWRALPDAEATVDEQLRRAKAAYDRIRERLQAGLDQRQFAQLTAFHYQRLEVNRTRLTAARWSRPAAFFHWLIDFYFFVILPLNCVRVCGGLVRDEVQADTLSFLTTRPLSRAGLLGGKYLCQTAWLQIVLLIETLLLFGAGRLLQMPDLAAVMPLFLAAQILVVPAWCALGTLMGQLTKRYMAMAMVYGLIVEVGIGRIPSNINSLSLVRHLKSLLANDATLQKIYEWTDAATLFPIGALVVATGIFLGLALLLFTFREYHHTAEMQK